MKKKLLSLLVCGVFVFLASSPVWAAGDLTTGSRLEDTTVGVSLREYSCRKIDLETAATLNIGDLVCVFKSTYALLALALPGIVAVFMILYSGFLFIRSEGDPSIIKKAGDTFIWAFIGLAIVALAAVIVHFFGLMLGIDYGI